MIEPRTQSEEPVKHRNDHHDIEAMELPVLAGKGRAATCRPPLPRILTLEALPIDAHPRLWSYRKRAYIALIVWLSIAPMDMAASIYAGAIDQVQAELHASHTLAVLGISVVNLGIALGPLVGAPLNETLGRRPVYLVCMFGFVVFSIGSGAAPNMATLLICRQLAGAFSGPPFSNFGGTLGDIFDDDERGMWVALYTLMMQGAPSLAPVLGDWMGEMVSWRWICYLTAIWTALCLLIMATVPETHAQVILQRHARNVRKQDPHANVLAPLELDGSPLWKRSASTLGRPVAMLLTEPMLLSTTIYHAFVYSLLFMLLEIYPLVYRRVYGLGLGLSGTAFVAPWLGTALGVLLYFAFLAPRHAKLVKAGLAKPESRLPGLLIASISIPLGLFWFSLTSSSPSIHPVVSMASGIPIGVGLTLAQISISNYYIDCYTASGRASSALASNLLLRALAATASPLCTSSMYDALGPRNASIVLASLATLGLPMALVLIWRGARLRQSSKHAIKDCPRGPL